MLKHNLMSFNGSRYLDGTLMYPGKYACTWVYVAGVWVLLCMEPV